MCKAFQYKPLLLLVLLCVGAACSSLDKAQESAIQPKSEVVALAEQNFKDAAAQYKVLMQRLHQYPDDRFPKTYYANKDSLETSGSDWWVSGFYPGTLLYLYEETGDEALLQEAQRIMRHLEKEKSNTTTHDLGFMMFDSFGNLQRIKPSEENKQIMLESAKSLASRFNPTVGAIKSWDSDNPNDYIVIIDNMMNLDLLFWASQETGDPQYRDIAIKHANTTMEHHFRPDFSTYHVVNYDINTGEPKEKKTAQGYSDSSAWARGQAWGFYGYVETYRNTKDKKYLEQARNIAGFVLNHPNLPEDKIPYWDFNAPNIPNALRDASAAAIMASGLLELSQYVDEEEGRVYFDAAETIIKNLSGPTYKAALGENGGFILKHGVGHLPAGTEIDVPLTYGDYYFIEAMKRYKDYPKGVAQL